MDDVVKVILSHLEHAELARIATINRIFHKNCTALLPLYPQQIKLEPINAPYNGMQRNYVYQYTVVALPEDLIKVDRIEFHVEPNKLIGPPYVLEVPLDGSQLIFNVRHCAHVDYELSCSFFTVAYKGACGTRSAVVHRKLPPTSEIDVRDLLKPIWLILASFGVDCIVTKLSTDLYLGYAAHHGVVLRWQHAHHTPK